jgi:hypothetical protein
MQGEREGRPILMLLAEELEASSMARHPWWLEVELRLREPNEHGLPGKEELKALQHLEDQLLDRLGEMRSVVHWGTRTWSGNRTMPFYLDDCLELKTSAVSLLAESGYPPSLAVKYDSRWQEYRAYRPKS